MTIQFNTKDVRTMGRTAMGVRAIKLDKDDAVVSMNIKGDETYLLVVTRNGFGKRPASITSRTKTEGARV